MKHYWLMAAINPQCDSLVMVKQLNRLMSRISTDSDPTLMLHTARTKTFATREVHFVQLLHVVLAHFAVVMFVLA